MTAVNRIIKILIYSDVAIVTAFSFYGPIFAIFIANHIRGGGPALAGFAVATYWVVRTIVQLPISHYLDRHDGERDDFWALVGGSFLFSIVPLLYLFASEPWHVILFQVIYGIGDSLAVPTYLSIYGRHVDKTREGLEWGLRSVTVGIGAAIAGAAGGLIAAKFGFKVVFLLTSALSFTGSAILLILRGQMNSRIQGGVTAKITSPTKEHGQ
ncbi:MAG TPA: MFS transporter [Candidatus Paceibacterota bacterium]|nr:MFS transporter [Candidatus Paceibacterota bacterium]